MICKGILGGESQFVRLLAFVVVSPLRCMIHTLCVWSHNQPCTLCIIEHMYVKQLLDFSMWVLVECWLRVSGVCITGQGAAQEMTDH